MICGNEKMKKGLNDWMNYWFDEQFYAVGVLSFVGVLVRTLIINDFIDRNEQSANLTYGPFIQMFYTQPYLLPNLLGTFFMGVFFAYKDDINGFSKGFQKGLTTGFCGSLTTFSTWMYTAFYTPFTSNNWYKIFIMVFIEALLTWCALTLGISAGKSLLTLQQNFLKAPHEGREESSKQNDDRVSHDLDSGVFHYETIEMQNIDNAVVSHSEIIPPNRIQEPQSTSTMNNLEWWIWFILFWSCAISFWITLGFLPTIDYFQHYDHRDTFRSVCFAPFGAWLRWSLTKIPPITNFYPTLYLHTMIANTIAVLFSSLLGLYSRSSWTFALNYGISGSCSTVSTLFFELYELNEKFGSLYSFRYAFVTFLVAVLILQITVSTS